VFFDNAVELKTEDDIGPTESDSNRTGDTSPPNNARKQTKVQLNDYAKDLINTVKETTALVAT